MDWKQQLLSYGKDLERIVHDSPLGAGIEYSDGCDVFWVLPGEVMSTVAVPVNDPILADELIDLYNRIDHLRNRVLHTIRHYLASQNVRITRNASGEWGLEMEGGLASSLSVGPYLTAVVRDTQDVYESVTACIRNSLVRKAPSRKRIDRYLSTAEPPADRSIQPRQAIEIQPTIHTALGLLGICRALDSVSESSTPQSIAKSAAPSGRIAQALLHFAERLPGVEAYLEVTRPATISLRFADGYADFDVAARSRELATRVAKDGPVATGDALADEFLSLQAARSTTFRAIWRAAAARGWKKEWLRVLNSDPVISLGRTIREVNFNPGESLTVSLRTATHADVLRQLFQAQDPSFADECVRVLTAPADGPEAELPEASLRPRDIPPAPPLRTLDAETVAELDVFAQQRIEEFLSEERTIWSYHDRMIYDPAIDSWADLSRWVSVAQRHIGGELPHPMAIVILLDANDPRGPKLAEKYLAAAQPHHEASDAEVELIWRFRHRYPDAAKKWFTPQQYDQAPFAKVRARLGDPVAIRSEELAREDVGEEPDETEVGIDIAAERLPRLTPRQLDELHRAFLDWARNDHHWSPARDSRLDIASAMGWRDVADAFEQNPFMLARLLTRERRKDGFDEPGMLLSRTLLLRWSHLAPSQFLARLIATAQGTDLVGLAEEASRQSVINKPRLQKNFVSISKIYRHWMEDLEPAMAIAWMRCRRYVAE